MGPCRETTRITDPPTAKTGDTAAFWTWRRTGDEGGDRHGAAIGLESSRGLMVIVLEQTAEPLLANDLFGGCQGLWFGQGLV